MGTVEMKSNRDIFLTYTMPDGEKSVIKLVAAGNGPGELWSCHWDFWICLPASYEQEFIDTTVGLLGTPDGNTANDWMTPDGETLPLVIGGEEKHEAAMEYCYDNWCVSQEESIMSYHSNTNYGDHKCEDEPHRDFN